MIDRLTPMGGTGPLPHPTAHAAYPGWVAGWGSGLVPPARREARR